MDRFHKIHGIERKTTGWIYMVRGRLTRKHMTSRPDTVWPEIWKDMSDASKRKEEQKWAMEKPKLDNARRLRGIYFIERDRERQPKTTHVVRNVRQLPAMRTVNSTNSSKHSESCVQCPWTHLDPRHCFQKHPWVHLDPTRKSSKSCFNWL